MAQGKENRGRNQSKGQKRNASGQGSGGRKPGSAHSSSEKSKKKSAGTFLKQIENKTELKLHNNLLRKQNLEILDKFAIKDEELQK